LKYQKFRRLLLSFVLVALLFCGSSYGRRVQNINSEEFVVDSIGEELSSISRDLNSAAISALEAEERYFKIIERCYVIFNSKPKYSQFLDSLRYMEIAFNGYNRCLNSGYSKVDTNTQAQSLFRSISLDMTYLLSDSYGYIQGLSSKVLKDVIPLLSDSFLGRAIKRKLKNDLSALLSSREYTVRYHALSCIGLLIEHYPNQRVQSDLTVEIAELLYDSDVYVVGSAIQALEGVLSSIDLRSELKNKIISNLISLYGRSLAYPQNAYLTECLRVLVGNEPEIWHREIYEVLSRHDILSRDKNLSYIFGKN